MSENLTIFVTSEHFLKGVVHNRGQRLLDTLKDRATEFLSVQSVEVFRRCDGKRLESFSEAIVRKASIGLAVPAGERHEAPQRRIDAFVSKKEYPVFLVVLGYEVRGKMQLQGPPDPVTTLCREFGDFIPIPQGTVSFAGGTWEEMGPRVIIANRSYVSLFQIGQPAGGQQSLAAAELSQ